MSKNKILNLELNKDAIVSVSWSANFFGRKKEFPLCGAMIEILENRADGTQIPLEDSKKNPVIGKLDQKGQFKFKVLKQKLNFTVRIVSQYVDDPHKAKQTQKFKVLGVNKKEHTVMFHNQLICKIGETKEQDPLDKTKQVVTNPWSIFQAMVDLVDATEQKLKLYGDYGDIYSYSTSNTSYFNLKGMFIHKKDQLLWNVIGHEFSHLLDHRYGISDRAPVGSPNHDLNKNQYDYKDNGSTVRNKERSISLVFGESFATWLGLILLEDSTNYKKLFKMLWPSHPFKISLLLYSTNEGGINFPIDLDSIPEAGVYGEDAETSIVRILWNMTRDDRKDRVFERTSGVNKVHIDIIKLFNALKGKKILNIDKFYKCIFNYYFKVFPEKFSGNNSNPEQITKIDELGCLFAEFGIAPFIEQAPKINQLNWAQYKTGTLPGHDKFDVYFYNYDRSKVLYTIPSLKVGAKNGTEGKYEYQLSPEQIKELDKAVQDNNNQDKHIFVMIKAIASGETASNGGIETGPYFSNLATYSAGINKSVIAVDSSGSNEVTDPSDTRKEAAHDTLDVLINANRIVSGGNISEYVQPVTVMAMDFDHQVKWLPRSQKNHQMTDPQTLKDLKVFNEIDSYGLTKIALAINAAIEKLILRDEKGETIIIPNDKERNRLYLLTDMADSEGGATVEIALDNANDAGIIVHEGLLRPKKQSRSISDSFGDTLYQGTERVHSSFDSIIEKILKTGGSYTVIENAESQKLWVQLVDYLTKFNSKEITVISLPLDLAFHRLTYKGIKTPTYKITPEKSGAITVTVDSKGKFIPDLKVDGKGIQKALGNDLYEVTFRAVAGKTYDVEINKPLDATGLYPSEIKI